MCTKLEEVIAALTSTLNQVDSAYSCGVVDGFNKEHRPQFLLGH